MCFQKELYSFQILPYLNIIGNKNINHATFVYPNLQIDDNIHVQNIAYNICIINTKLVSGTLQSYGPAQNTCLFPIF